MFEVEVVAPAPPPDLEVMSERNTPASDAPRERSDHLYRWGPAVEGVALSMTEAQIVALFERAR